MTHLKLPDWPPIADPSSRTWLATHVSDKPAGDRATSAIDSFLAFMGGRIRPLVCWYQGTTHVKASRAFDNGSLETGGQKWTCGIDAVPGHEAALDLTATFTLATGTADSAGVAVAIDFDGWASENYVLAPAALYNGNRYRVLPIGYAPYIYDPKDRPLDMPITITNAPHLNVNGDPAKVELLTGNCATPLLSFFCPKTRQGFIILTEQGTTLGNSGLFVQEDVSRKQATFVVSAPGVREERYAMCGRAPSGDCAADWKAGDAVSLRLRLYVFAAADIPAFLNRVCEVRKDLSGATRYRHVTPYSAAADMIAAHHDKTKWFENERFGYICNRNDNTEPAEYLQAGWGGVPVYSLPHAILETPERLRRVCRSTDTLTTYMQSKSGLIYGMFRDGVVLGDNFNENRQRPSIAMVRRSGEVLYFGLRQNMLLRARNHPEMVQPGWETMLRRMADGLADLWHTYKQFGQTVDVETGKMEINGSSAGTVCVSGLALASRYFGEPRYMEIAEAAGRLYYERDLRQGYVGGGPAEILQCPDSESTYNLVEAYVVLYELTGQSQWLTYARDAASLFSTWMVSYRYTFPKGSDLARVGADATGSIWASVQNEHSAPGLYVSSGDFLLKLFRATGDERIAEMYKDTAHNVIQYVNTPTNPVGIGSAPGVVTERVNLSDWEGKEGVGAIPGGDSNQAWETLALLTCLENPGIYLHTDDDTLLVLDHVEAQVINRNRANGTATLSIANPTPYDAVVSVFAETAADASTPLGWNAFETWPKVAVAAGGRVTVSISAIGDLCEL